MRGLQNARNFLSAMGLTDKVPTPSLKITQQAVQILSEHREFFENWADLAKNAASLQGKAECEAFQSKLKKLSKKTPQAIREWLGS
jgi:sulfite reductase alpha subunit-like flavoprotein